MDKERLETAQVRLLSPPDHFFLCYPLHQAPVPALIPSPFPSLFSLMSIRSQSFLLAVSGHRYTAPVRLV